MTKHKEKPVPKTRAVGLHLDTYKRLRKLAKDEGRSMGRQVEWMLRDALSRRSAESN